MTHPLPPREPNDPPICQLWTLPQMLAVAAVIVALFSLLLVATPNPTSF